MDQRRRRRARSTGWDPVADWYAGWVGSEGSEHHQRLAIPAVLELLAPQPGEHVLDIGAGSGVLAPAIAATGASYTGVEISPKLLAYACDRHARHGRFLRGDATRLRTVAQLEPASFDSAVFLLSIQDIAPLEEALESAAWALRPGGRLVLLMLHPCFRVPRQSGWGWDEGRGLRYRRIDSYATPLDVPMKSYSGGRGATRSYHRPLAAYVNGLADCGLLIDRLLEIPTYQTSGSGRQGRAANRANQEIPLFLGLRAWRLER